MSEAAKIPPPFEHVVIVGVGLLGASLGLAMREKGLAGQITGVGRAGSRSLETAQRRQAIHAASYDLGQAAGTADLIILCVPVRQFRQAMQTLRGKTKPGAILIDVGSTKFQVMQWAREILAANEPVFVGCHPMAGSEKRGPDHARADLYDGGLCLLCQSAGDKESHALQKVESLWRTLGMRTLRLDPQAHDEWVANISHLPHAAATALVETVAQNPSSIQAAAGGLFDTTRIASSDIEMWTDICLTNGQPLSAALGRYIQALQSFKSAVDTGNEAAIRAHLAAAKTARDQWLAQRQATAAKTDRRA